MTARNLDWLLVEFARDTAGVRDAVLVSAGGLRLATSSGLDRTLGDQLAAASSGLVSLARGAAHLLSGGPVTQTILEMAEGYLFVTAVAEDATLAVYTDRRCHLGLVGHEMTLLAVRMGHVLGPGVRAGGAGQ